MLCAHTPNILRSRVGTSQGAGMGLMSSQTAQPRMSPDLSPASPPVRGLIEVQSLTCHCRALGDQAKQKGKGRWGRAQAEATAWARVSTGTATCCRLHARREVGRHCRETYSKLSRHPTLSSDQPVPRLQGPHMLPAPSCPRWVFLCSVGEGCSACRPREAG